MDVALGCLLLRKTSSTPAVVPGAAPALAKAGVGGFKRLRATAGQGPNYVGPCCGYVGLCGQYGPSCG